MREVDDDSDGVELSVKVCVGDAEEVDVVVPVIEADTVCVWEELGTWDALCDEDEVVDAVSVFDGVWLAV